MKNPQAPSVYHKFLWFILASTLLVLELASWWSYRKHIHEIIVDIFRYDYHHKNWSLESAYEHIPIVQDTLKIDLSEIAFQELAKEWNTHYKNLHRIDHSPWIDKKSKHTARVKYLNGHSHPWQKAEVSIIGMLADHHGDFERMSLKVNLKGDNRLFGKKSFSLVLPETRMFFVDQLANEAFASSREGLQIRTQPVWVKFRKNKPVMMLLEDRFDKFLIESNQRRESILFEKGFKGNLRDIPGIESHTLNWSCNAALKDSLRQVQLEQWVDYTFNRDNKSLFEHVDHEKVRSVWAIGMLCESWHHWVDINMHWYYNPVNNLFEPTIREVNLDPQWRFTGKVDNYENRKRNYQKYVQKIQKEIVADRPNFLVSYAIWGEKNLPNFWEELDKEVLRSADFLRKSMPKYQIPSIPLSARHGKNYQEYYQELSTYLNAFPPSTEPNKTEKKPVNNSKIAGEYVITGLQTNINNGLYIAPGTTIRFTGKQAVWVIKSGVHFEGTASNPIKIEVDSNCMASIFMETSDSVRIQFVHFNGLSNLSWETWKTPSAITIHETDHVQISHCTFRNNRSGDDYLNLFRCNNFMINDCLFEDVLSDAFDSDFSNGKVKNTRFNRIGNDGIDGSGSNIAIHNCVFEHLKDKAISSGEKSKFSVTQSQITNAEIGLVSKDHSTLNAKNTSMQRVRLPIAVFQKKPEYGAASLSIDNDINTTYYLIENGSEIKHLGGNIEWSKDVKDKLYGNEYGSATKK